MNYRETLDFLFSQLPMYQRQGASAYKADLSTTLQLDEHFRNPHKHYPTIHVAGTNGKGSVSHMISSVLQEAGFKVGLYTSPHLKDFRERIKINGAMVNEDFVVQFVGYNQDIIKQLQPSFFEITAAMAFDYFARERVDVAVIETGMGGRLDSTNIINPELSIITNIGLDHTKFLVDTIEKIAWEKAGIIKAETPVVIGEKVAETANVFATKSQELAAPVHMAEDRFEIIKTFSEPPYYTQKVTLFDRVFNENIDWEIDLTGNYQANNLLTVLTALDILSGKFKHKLEHKLNGLKRVRKNTGFAGRWEILNKKPLTIADTAHNTEGLQYVLSQLNEIEYNHLHIVLGVVDDKNLESILPMFPKKASYYFCKANIPRALDEKALKSIAFKYNLQGESFESVLQAFEAAKSVALSNDLIFIGGSTFTVAEALS
ncbi:MAG: dihydrofolate synthase [Salinivirgaceae bacterium]|nr:MAG: dihydrofolate synthase [Salinivirgaceae bacterium]